MAADPNTIVPITRDQLAKFLPDNDTIRRFEKLFLIAGSTTPANIEIILSLLQEATIAAGSANATANQANALADRLEQALLLVALSPAVQIPPYPDVFIPVQEQVVIPDNLAPPIQIGTLGEQQADRVKITGGTINGTAIGGTTPAAVAATTLSSSAATTVGALLDISAAGAGQIKFPATQNPSANANTLDDYRESNYTPTVAALAGTLTTASAIGTYTKVGRKVSGVAIATITTNGTGAVGITISLPSTAMATYTFAACGTESALTGYAMACRILPSTSLVRVLRYDGAYPAASGSVIEVSFTYFEA